MGIPQRIQSRITRLLREDGFRRSIDTIHVKRWHGDWCAWIAFDGSPYSLSPRVGVYNDELVRIRDEAVETVGRLSEHKAYKDAGPPLIMTLLDRLLGDDPDCTRRMSWHYNGDRCDTGLELPTSVADDVVYCMRKKAYPFFDAHLTLESIIEAARAGIPSFALANYVPIILLKMGRRKEVPAYVEGWTKRFTPEIAGWMERYVDALIATHSRETRH
jgi:hypothetical protein